MRLIFIILAFAVTLLCIPQLVGASPANREEITNAISLLAPRVSFERATKLAGYITYHSNESKIDPLLITAIIFRESSFSYAVQMGKKLGPGNQKCRGLMQIYPWGAAHKLGGYCDLFDADCNIRTGSMWLEYVRGTCGDTHWQWVAAYGMRQCPSYIKARQNGATVAARRIYCQIKGNCAETWPRWER